jgi:hypothetical protein
LISLAQEPIVYVLLYFNKPEIITHDYQIETCNVTVSLFYILQKLVLNKSCMFWRSISTWHFRNLHQMALLLIPCWKCAQHPCWYNWW